VTPIFPIAAEHGNGVADVLDAIVEILPEVAIDEEPTGDYTRVAVVGRPNVGKSSLANAMIGSQRHVVSDVSGTTRDAIDTTITYKDRDYVLVDTAGIRRGARQDGFAEFVSVAIARKRMARADVALLVIDATVGLTRQDRSVADEAQTAGCGLVVVVNKWDLVDVERGDSRSWHKELRERLGRMAFAEVVYTSALKGDGVQALFATINRVAENRLRRVPTGELNGFFEHLLRRGPQGPPGAPELKYLTQVSVGPPTFVFFAGKGRRDMPTSYTRFLENRLRENFTLGGTPVRIIIRRREQRAR
jgi:GTP-binding protein